MSSPRIMVAAIALTLGLGLGNGSADAWNETGHRLVAQIAWDSLPAPTRRQAAELVAVIDGIDFVSASVWLDQVRADGVHLFDRWHYINLPVGDGSVTPKPPQEDNVLWAIATARTGLAKHQASPTARALALVSLLHLVGDVHQPLHAAGRFDRRFPDGDRGGNDVLLAKPWRNLHALWDRMGGAYRLPGHRPDENDVARWAAEIRRAHPPASLPRHSALDPTVWATESHHLAETVAYPGVARGATPDPAYLERVREVARERIALAGYRLAAVIEAALDPRGEK